MSNDRKVKVFEEKSVTALEEAINEWLADTGISVASIAYSAARDSYSALVYYICLEESHQTEPLAE